MTFSDDLRISIKAKEAARQFNRRKEAVLILMKQHNLDAHRAVEMFKNHCVAKIGFVPNDVLADLSQIREELSNSETASAV